MRKIKDYHEFNKSTWFLFCLISENNKKITRETYLIDDYLENTYIYPTEEKNRLYIKYKNSPEVNDIEDYLTCDYLKDIIYSSTHTVYVYEISNDLDVYNYECFIRGRYSEMTVEYKLKICLFWQISNDHQIAKIFRKDDILWHNINKSLGCMAKECSCKIVTEQVLIDNRKKTQACNIQDYLGCSKFEKFTMPNQKLIELEDHHNINSETIEL
jgi:hypothetical protein